MQQQSFPDKWLSRKGRPRGKQCHQQVRPAGYQSPFQVGDRRIAQGTRDADDERKDGYDNDCHEGSGVH